jgi:formiminotetrahydrofolate cyclodeaminase
MGGMSYRRETPFDNIESAEQFVELLIEAIKESRRDVDAEIGRAEANRSGGSERALHLVSTNLAKLSEHMTTSRRILNHLKTLRRLLLKERRLDNTLQTGDGNRELSRWP